MTTTLNATFAPGRVVRNTARPADARGLPAALTARAIARWEAARTEAADARRLAGAAGEELDGDRWGNLAVRLELDARRSLIAAILNWGSEYPRSGGDRYIDPGRWRWEPRGVVSGGKLYLAVASDPDEDAEHVATGLTEVLVIPMPSVVNLDEIHGELEEIAR